MRTTIRDKVSLWREVTSAIPQGTVLAPIMFAVYIIGVPEGVESYVNMFEGNARVLQKIQDEKDQDTLQQDLDKMW